MMLRYQEGSASTTNRENGFLDAMKTHPDIRVMSDNRFGVNVISHTQAVTTLGQAKVGQRVNLEVDMLARYVQRLLEHHKS